MIFICFQIMEYEQVHPTRGWDEFKRRLKEDRRCFIFTHRLLPGEPLVILHTALGDHLRFNMKVSCFHIVLRKGLSLSYDHGQTVAYLSLVVVNLGIHENIGSSAERKGEWGLNSFPFAFFLSRCEGATMLCLIS